MSRDIEYLTKALELQHTRCEVYQLWDAKFHTALSGALSVAEFQTTLSETIIAAFQRVSSSLRQLQELNKTQEGEVKYFLDSWIDKVQLLEQQHYNTSVHLTQLIAQHCTLIPFKNSLTITETKENKDEVEVEDKLNNKIEDNKDENNKEKKVVITESVENNIVLASLHDMEECAICRLLPIVSQSNLTFVSCRDAFLLCSLEEETAEEEEEEEENNNNLISFVVSNGSSGVYAPREVYQQCAAFNKEVLPLWKKKQELKQELQELTEELQEELASVVVV